MAAPLYQPARLLASLAGHVLDLEVDGQLPAGGCVVCPGHLSFLDPLPLLAGLWPRRLRFMGTHTLFGLPVGHLYPTVGAFPVRRGRGDLGAVARAARLAGAGEAVVIFPEGKRRKGEGHPRRGAARAAQAAGVPLVPVGLAHPARGRWRVAVGTPIETLGRGPSALTEELWAAILRLEGELCR